MPAIECPDCGRRIAVHELETNTIARQEAFETTYRCPACGADFDEVSGLL